MYSNRAKFISVPGSYASIVMFPSWKVKKKCFEAWVREDIIIGVSQNLI